MGSELRSLWESAGGIVPSDWKVIALEDLLLTPKSISVGVMYPGKHVDEGVPLIKVSDVTKGAIPTAPTFCISATVDEEYKRTRLAGKELLLTLVGNPGDCVLATNDMARWNAARALAVLTFKKPDLRYWVRMILLSNPSKHIIDSRLNTTVQRTLNLKDVKQLPIPIPPENIRNKLCDISLTVENKIQLNRQTNQTLEQMAQALFKSWFVDFDPVIDNALAAGNPIPEPLLQQAEVRKAQAASSNSEPSAGLPKERRGLFPSEFEHSEELGWVPKGWKVETTNSISETNALSWAKRNAPEFVDYVDLGNAKNGQIVEFQKYEFSEAPSRAKRILKIHDSIIGLVRPGNRSFAYVDRVGLTGSTGFAVMTPKHKNLRAYLYFHLTRDEVIDEFARLADGAAYPAIKPEIVTNFTCLIPSDEVLDLFQTLSGSNLEKIGWHIRENEALSATRDILLPKLISGELRIPDVEKIKTQRFNGTSNER